MGNQLNMSAALTQGKYALLEAKYSSGKVKIFYHFQVGHSPISTISLSSPSSHTSFFFPLFINL